MGESSYHSVKNSSFTTPSGVRYFKRVEQRTRHSSSSVSESSYGGGRDYSRSSKSIKAFSYSCHEAHYPRLYEKLKSPKAARKNLQEWKASVDQLPLTNRPSLPPQDLIFAKLEPITNKRGDLLVLVCTLSASYPNFSLNCTTEFTEQIEVHNGRTVSDARGASAVISTATNSWRILFEWIGWNSNGLRTAIGNENMNLLEEAKEVRKGDSTAVASVTAQFDKKVTVPGAYEVNRIWSETKGFYRLEIYIPKRTYKLEESE